MRLVKWCWTKARAHPDMPKRLEDAHSLTCNEYERSEARVPSPQWPHAESGRLRWQRGILTDQGLLLLRRQGTHNELLCMSGFCSPWFVGKHTPCETLLYPFQAGVRQLSAAHQTTQVNSGFFYSSAEQREKLVAAERQVTDDRVQRIIDLKNQVQSLVPASLSMGTSPT